MKKKRSRDPDGKVNLKDFNERIAQRWKMADSETRKKYAELAIQDKIRYEKEVADMKAAGTWVEREATPSRTQLPVARIKRIVKLDPEVKNLNKEALFLLTKATELFIETAAGKTSDLFPNNRTFKLSHICYAVHTDSTLEFLQDDFRPVKAEDLPKSTVRSSASSRVKTKEEQEDTQEISQYFINK
eukprot:g4973.t1